MRWILIQLLTQVLHKAAKVTLLTCLPCIFASAASADVPAALSDDQNPQSWPLSSHRLSRQGESAANESAATMEFLIEADWAERPWLDSTLNQPNQYDLAFVGVSDRRLETDWSYWPTRANADDAQAVERTTDGDAGTEDSGTEDSGTEDSGETETDADSELGSELGELRIRSRDQEADPELGILRIREQPISTSDSESQRPIAYLTGRVGYINSDNIFLAIDDQLGVIGDDFLRSGVALSFYPALGPETFLLAIAEANFQRYTSIANANYDELRFRVGVRQGLTPRAYGEIGWSYQQLFRPSFRDRFFENNAFDITLRRQDLITEALSLSSYYRAQLNLSNPASFDRVIQALGTYAGYGITPNLEVGLNYQLTLADYTQQDRYDTYHQLLGQLVYSIQPATRLSLFGGISFGRSSEPTVTFDDVIFGVFLESSLVLF